MRSFSKLSCTKNAVWCIAIITLLCATAGAQQRFTPLNSNDILGFEALGTWTVNGNSSPPGFLVMTSANRTQASAAYAIANPPNMVKLISQPVSSTATALTGIGNADALLQVDVLIPVQQGNKVNSGYVQPYVTSRSLGLSKVALAQVFFSGYRAGIYNTIAFALPENVRSALGGAVFNDLVLEFDISSPGKITGTYLVDNVRVHSSGLSQDPTGQEPPPGYGGSVDLVVFGNAPVAQNHDLSPTQIPGGFHLKLGTVGSTHVEFKLGLDGNANVTCTYGPDANDDSGRSYVFNTCTGGFQPGDLVNSNWVSLGIVGGNDTQKIRAQIALNPLGDVAGAGLLPPMPTFWGDADACTPAPVDGTVVTLSMSCAEQIAQANTIATQYFEQVQNSNPPHDWIVPPVPEFAQRHGDGTPTDFLTGPPEVPTDPPFDTGSHLNSGGTFDAYWRLFGNLTPTAVPNTDENKTHFEATFGAHSVLFGYDVDVASVKLTADTDSGQTTPTYKAATSTGNAGLYLFGIEVPSGGLSVSPSAGFSIDPKISDTFNLPPIQIWIFSITLGADAAAELNAAASAAVSGLDLSVTPSASLGMHVSGGIDLGIASGKVDAKVNLATLATPVIGQVKWVIDTSPQVCSTTLQGKLKSDLNLSSGGGKVDLVATYGICPFCDSDTYNLFKWDPLVSKSWNLYNATIDTQLFGLPASMCSFTSTASIVSPTSGATLNSGVPITLSGTAAPTDSSLGVDSVTYNWTYTPGANASTATVNSGGNTAHPSVTFGAPTSGTTSTWTIGLSATVTLRTAGGTLITSTATATPVTVNVSAFNNGVAITDITNSYAGAASQDANGVFGIYPAGTNTVAGVVVGSTGTLNTTFTIALCTDTDYAGYSATCATSNAPVALATANAGSTSPSAGFAIGQGTYRITMTTTQDGTNYGTASVLVYTSGIL